MIRPATIEDAQTIADLWNPYVDNTTATFNSIRYTAQSVRDIIEHAKQNEWAFVVAVEGSLLGFAKYQQFRGGIGYAHSMEHGIYLSESARGKGIGEQLMNKIEAHAALRGVHSMTGVVTAGNAPSIRFHERLGYKCVGEMPEIGFKFGEWLGAIFMQKILNTPRQPEKIL